MENSLENKDRFFAQYWGQNVLKRINEFVISDRYVVNAGNIERNLAILQLELTPLSQITDEDAIEVAKMCYKNEQLHTIKEGKGLSEHYYASLCLSDYLRSKGYALPYMGLSVEKLIEYGWVKLKSNSNEQ